MNDQDPFRSKPQGELSFDDIERIVRECDPDELLMSIPADEIAATFDTFTANPDGDSDELEIHETPPEVAASLGRILALSPAEREAWAQDFNKADGKAYAQHLADEEMFQKMLNKFGTIAPLPPSLAGMRSTSDQIVRLCGTATTHRKMFRDLPKHINESPEQRKRRQARNRRKAARRKAKR